MYQIFKDQLDKSKLIITGVKRNQRLGREAGVGADALERMEDAIKRLEAMSAEIDKMQEEIKEKSLAAHEVLDELKGYTFTVKKSIKQKYDQTWWCKFGIPDKR